MAQDDLRESEQIQIFGLQKKTRTNRSGKYVTDSIITIGGVEYCGELKTGCKNSFSTSRGMCRDKIDNWKKANDFYIFSKYKNTKTGFKFVRHIVCKGEHLQFFFDDVIDKVDVSGHAGKAGLDEYTTLVRPLLVERLSDDLLTRIDKTVKIGTEYNNLKININKIVKAGGVELDLEKCPKKQLIDFLTNNT